MDIEIAGKPETFDDPDGGGIGIRIPLTGAPDELLVAALENSPPLSSFCEKLEPRERELVVYPKEAGVEGLSTMLTAVQALITIANDERAARAMTDEQKKAAAAEARKRELDGVLETWWAERG